MGLYDRYVLPRLVDFFMRGEALATERARLVPLASGEVLEVGIGSGLNIPFYGPKVERLYGVDPSSELLAMVRRKINHLPFPVELLCRSAEQLPLDNESIDTAVATWTLCSIADPSAALSEMKRVLKPKGHLLFVEHGFSPEPKVQVWQNRINPIWKKLAGGCNLNRKIDDLLTSAGFRILQIRTTYLPGPRPMTYTYQGSATAIEDVMPLNPSMHKLSD